MDRTAANLLAGCLLILAVAVPCRTLAEDYPHRTEHLNRSLFEGMGPKSDLNLLNRNAGPGRALVLGSLKQRLKSSGLIPQGSEVEEDDGRRALVRGDGWRLTVFADGTRIRFRNREAIRANEDSGLRIPLGGRMNNQEMEDRGRAFIASQLTDIVVLSEAEELVPLYTEHEVGQAERSDGYKTPPFVTASNVIFGRTIDGVDVVGPGSKVAVLFAVDGSVVGFDSDWPSYNRSPRSQKMLDVQAIRQRASTLSNARFKTDGADEVDLKSFRCGYVDMGTRRRGRDAAAPIQGGCTASYVGRRWAFRNPNDPQDGAETSARTFYVPAGVRVLPDDHWPEVSALVELGDISKAPQSSPAASVPPPAQDQ